ncbi:MAG: recombinase family protein [Phenylobacterium sp.]|uniref:recombinase family protein n=1 Tax=Phenylobacterium sp. TaxID=1871053 RepID=UPI001B3FC4B2|nr:recombinase family protein [Phenylobacterium sp.]MBP7818059.1 recombinase family protein [Phenylobacterium sp.]MBP9753789.1 recombinase family protein [Phenylobacterium sp.]
MAAAIEITEAIGTLPAPRIRAAQYVRMSTDHQRYSTENQGDAIAAYAAIHGMDIVATYADEGKSGLNIAGREALQRLIDDIEGKRANFEALLVYDVSRWGRFQDADESAFYEYQCRRAGVRVIYCAEQFENDGTPVATIVKSVKRAMAGEYSRELSSKVFAGQCRLIELGYRQGGPAGFGLRRVLVDERGESKGVLSRGEQKSLQTDRVILVPGPPEELDLVRRIYRLFVSTGMTEAAIALLLNSEGLVTDLGRPWTRATVHQVLTNEKYIGNNVFNRRSFKLKVRRVQNPPEKWIRAEGVFEPVVDHERFLQAREIILERSKRFTNEELLERLQGLLERHGAISGLIIDERADMPSSSAYRSRFGSLLRAYQLIGYRPARDYRFLQINQRLRELHPEVLAEIHAGIIKIGGVTTTNEQTGLVAINDELTVSVAIARCHETASGAYRWRFAFDNLLLPDITVAVRMAGGNERPLDYFLFPSLDLEGGRLRVKEENGLSIDAYRFDDLSELFELAIRIPFSRAA